MCAEAHMARSLLLSGLKVSCHFVEAFDPETGADGDA